MPVDLSRIYTVDQALPQLARGRVVPFWWEIGINHDWLELDLRLDPRVEMAWNSTVNLTELPMTIAFDPEMRMGKVIRIGIAHTDDKRITQLRPHWEFEDRWRGLKFERGALALLPGAFTCDRGLIRIEQADLLGVAIIPTKLYDSALRGWVAKHATSEVARDGFLTPTQIIVKRLLEQQEREAPPAPNYEQQLVGLLERLCVAVEKNTAALERSDR